MFLIIAPNGNSSFEMDIEWIGYYIIVIVVIIVIIVIILTIVIIVTIVVIVILVNVNIVPPNGVDIKWNGNVYYYRSFPIMDGKWLL